MKIGNIEIKKNYLYIGLGVIVILLIALIYSCTASKKLVCTFENNSAIANTKEINTFKFKKNRLSEMIIDYTYEAKEGFIDTLDEVENNHKKQLEIYKTLGGAKYTTNRKDNVISYKLTLDTVKIPDETIDNIGFSDAWSYDEVKKNLEANDFKCK